ncbi:YkvI family membrane protein [Sphingomonas hankyongi]|uniref:YkvI family membrane protein n=1 Tax=Sphingomonas hankyongi TaxID=2908209 RepID=UPI003242BB8D
MPGLGVKAVVIGGGYATGRELAEFFLSNGPWGGLYAILFASLLFSAICALTFVLARRFQTFDYKSFFKRLLGPAWRLFEFAYLLFVVLILAVYGAAAGAIGNAVFGAPEWAGTVALMAGIAAVVAFGNKAVERLFRDVSYYLYGVYALFIVLALWKFGDRVPGGFEAFPQSSGWALSGLTYFGYNIVGAVVILPVLRHLTSDRDAVIAGVISGPLTMLPALLFFVPMVAFYPDVQSATLPSDYLLGRIGIPAFHLLFQAMIFSALLESGTSSVHAINERIDHAWKARRGHALSHRARLAIALVLLVGCMFVASRFGLVALIANGYRALAYILLAVYVVPLLTIGVWQLRRREATSSSSSSVGESE